jgi:hypothetical protein
MDKAAKEARAEAGQRGPSPGAGAGGGSKVVAGVFDDRDRERSTVDPDGELQGDQRRLNLVDVSLGREGTAVAVLAVPGSLTAGGVDVPGVLATSTVGGPGWPRGVGW